MSRVHSPGDLALTSLFIRDAEAQCDRKLDKEMGPHPVKTICRDAESCTEPFLNRRSAAVRLRELSAEVQEPGGPHGDGSSVIRGGRISGKCVVPDSLGFPLRHWHPHREPGRTRLPSLASPPPSVGFQPYCEYLLRAETSAEVENCGRSAGRDP